MEQQEEVEELRRLLEEEQLEEEQRISLLNSSLNKALNMAAVHADRGVLARLKSRLYLSGVLSRCVAVLSQSPRMHRGSWSAAAATLAQLISTCCVGAEPDPRSEAFHRLFLPSVMESFLCLAAQLLRREESLFRKVFSQVCWLLQAHSGLTAQVLSSAHYEKIQMCDDVGVTLLCVRMWIHTCSSSRDFLSGLSDDSVLLLLNEAVGQLATESDPAVGGASVRLILLMANQEEERVKPLLLSFRGLDSLLDKDWRGRGLDQAVDQLTALIQSEGGTTSVFQACTERVRAACVIQAAWRSFQTRRRVKKLNRAVCRLQRRYRARKQQQQQQQEAQQWEEELRYQVCVRRQRARREFHQKQRKLLQLLPADQVQPYLQECERRAAVLIQSCWRGCRERRHYNNTLRHTLKHTHTQMRAARTLQRAVRQFLQKRRAAKAPPLPPFWIGQKGLTDSRRVELVRQVEDYITLHPSPRVSPQQCVSLHEEVQHLLLLELQRGEQQRREEERTEALLAHTQTQLELLQEAPPLCDVTEDVAKAFLRPSAAVAARARDSHNAMLQAGRLPWWRILGNEAAVDWSSPAHKQELEAELGGQFAGGAAGLGLDL